MTNTYSDSKHSHAPVTFTFSSDDEWLRCQFSDGQWVTAYWDNNGGEKDWSITGGSSAWAGDWLGEFRTVSSADLCFVSVFELTLPKEVSDRASKEFQRKMCAARPSISTHDSYYGI